MCVPVLCPVIPCGAGGGALVPCACCARLVCLCVALSPSRVLCKRKTQNLEKLFPEAGTKIWVWPMKECGGAEKLLGHVIFRYSTEISMSPLFEFPAMTYRICFAGWIPGSLTLLFAADGIE